MATTLWKHKPQRPRSFLGEDLQLVASFSASVRDRLPNLLARCVQTKESDTMSVSDWRPRCG